jgi:hypothetical protein
MLGYTLDNDDVIKSIYFCLHKGYHLTMYNRHWEVLLISFQYLPPWKKGLRVRDLGWEGAFLAYAGKAKVSEN